MAQSAMTACGAAAAVVCSQEFMNTAVPLANRQRAVQIVAQAMCTDLPSSFPTTVGDRLSDSLALAGVDMARAAADKCYQFALVYFSECFYRVSGLKPSQIDVAEVHDCFSCNELFMYEALQFCQRGDAVRLLSTGQWTPNANGGEVFR